MRVVSCFSYSLFILVMIWEETSSKAMTCYSCTDCMDVESGTAVCTGEVCVFTLTTKDDIIHIFRGCFNSKADVVEYIKKEDRDKKMKREERPETRLCYWKLCNSVSMSDLEGYEHRGSGGEIKTTSNVIFLTSLITIFNVNCRIKY